MIRKATNEDIPAVMDLLTQVLLVHHDGRPDIFKDHGQKFTETELVELFARDDYVIYLYENEDGKVIGHCFCELIDKPEGTNTYARKTIFIHDLCIDENARGQHVGKEMYEHVKEYALENGYDAITLHAWECNPNAVGFYKHLGMEIQQYTMEEIL